jgi:MarR family transcriptional regulator, organic hydroperoxide resistance regulator
MARTTRRTKASALPSAPDVAMDDVLTFMRLIWAIDHELERVSKQMEATLGLTIPQRMCLLLIGANPGILASQLAAILHLHRGTLSGILARLESSGLISRTVDPQDGRRAGLTLTAAGARLKGRRAGTLEKAVRALFATTSSEDRATTGRVLTALCRELLETRTE